MHCFCNYSLYRSFIYIYLYFFTSLYDWKNKSWDAAGKRFNLNYLLYVHHKASDLVFSVLFTGVSSVILRSLEATWYIWEVAPIIKIYTSLQPGQKAFGDWWVKLQEWTGLCVFFFLLDSSLQALSTEVQTNKKQTNKSPHRGTFLHLRSFAGFFWAVDSGRATQRQVLPRVLCFRVTRWQSESEERLCPKQPHFKSQLQIQDDREWSVLITSKRWNVSGYFHLSAATHCFYFSQKQISNHQFWFMTTDLSSTNQHRVFREFAVVLGTDLK